MNYSKRKWTLLVLAVAAIAVVGGCAKKEVPAAPPEAVVPQPKPQATLSVTPDAIRRGGGSATLAWSTQNATSVNIDGMGGVQPSGSQAVSPDSSTTYHLTAQGPGGTAEATARLTVIQEAAPPTPAPATPEAAAPSLTEADLFEQNVKDIYFDYDKYDLHGDAQSVIAADAAFFAAHPSIKFTIEGHCDERGSTDYNLALGDNRANAARDALIKAGVRADQIKTISYGKEKPFCTESTESCWQQNRRDHFVYGQ